MSSAWQIDTLGNNCDLYQPKTISTKEMSVDGKYPVYGANGIIGRYDHYNHEESQLLITCRGATCGTVNISEPFAWINGNAMVVRPKGSQLSRDFLAYYFRGGIDIAKAISGAAQPQITRQSLSPLEIPIPPLEEQKRIVAILDEAFAGIDKSIANTERNLTNAKELFESYLNSVFANPGEDWEERKFSELAAIKHGFAFKSRFFVDRGQYVLLTPGNFFEEGGYRDRGDKQKYYEGEIPEGYILPKGAFLIAMTEQAAGLLGSSIIVPEADRFLHNQRLGLVIPNERTQWHNDFFFHQFNTKWFRDRVHQDASGVKVRHTSPAKLGAIELMYPASLSEQEHIASKLNALKSKAGELSHLAQAKKDQLATLKQSILQKAFNGELTAKPERVLAEVGA